jgi:predicted dehydrogenase
LVCILSKSGDHADDARYFLEAGFNVAVEKPIALRPEQVVPLISLARAKGLIYAVVQQNRYNPAILKVREAIEEGRFGRLVLAGVRVHWSRLPTYYQDGWHGTWAMDGGILAQQAIHHLDALQWLAGPVESVCAYGDHLVNPAEAEDTAAVVVRFCSGAMGTVEATTAARPRDFEASLTIVGEGGSAKIGGIALNEILLWDFAEKRLGDERVAQEHSQAVPSGMGLSHAPYFRDLFAAMRRGSTSAPVDASEGLQSLRFVHAIYASMERESWVRMAEEPTSSRLGRVAKVIEHIRSRP